MSLKLYDHVLSAECYAVRLMLSFCHLKYQRVAVDAYPGSAEAPVLFDSDTGTELRDPGIILTYLAREYDIQWMPQEHGQALERNGG